MSPANFIIPPAPAPELAVMIAWALVVPALLFIAVIDCRRLEIDPWLTAIAVMAGAVLTDPASSWADGLLGGASVMAFSLVIRSLRSSSMGLGDLYLYGMCGFLVGISGLAAWAFLHALAAMLLAWRRSRRLGRPLLRTGMPAAVSACPTALLVMLL